MRHARTLSLFTAALALSACVEAPGGGPDDEPIGPRIVVAVDGLELSRQLDFGEVEAGQEVAGPITVSNSGDAALTIDELQLADADFVELQTAGYAPLLEADDTTSFEVVFAPQQDVDLEATLTIVSNAANAPEVEVTLTGDGLAPAVEVSPPDLEFGATPIGCVRTHEVTITSVGRLPASILHVGLEGGPELSLQPGTLGDDDPETPDFSLEPGAVELVWVDYEPVDESPDEGLLCVRSDTPGEATAGSCLPIAGAGHAVQPVIDTFVVPDRAGVDVMVVVDTGTSMSQELGALPDHAVALLEDLLELGIDFHLALTDADGTSYGQFLGPVPIITQATPDPEGYFASAATLTPQPWSNMGFLAAWDALVAAANSTGNNAGFLRGQSELRLLFVTDRADDSGLLLGLSWDEWVDSYRSFKTLPEQLVIGAVSGGTTGCADAGGQATASADLELAVQETGGPTASICSLDWSEELGADWLLPSGPVRVFPLSHPPVLFTLEVAVDGLPVADGWSFVAEAQAVVFEVDQAPDEGQSVAISYLAEPLCP